MPRRVVVFGEYGTLNGGENSFLSLLGHLRAGLCEVVASAPAGGVLDMLLRANGVAGFPRAVVDPARTQSSRRLELAQVIQRARPDVVHANSLSMSRR